MLSTEVEIDSTGDEASMGDEVLEGGTSQNSWQSGMFTSNTGNSGELRCFTRIKRPNQKYAHVATLVDDVRRIV